MCTLGPYISLLDRLSFQSLRGTRPPLEYEQVLAMAGQGGGQPGIHAADPELQAEVPKKKEEGGWVSTKQQQ